MELAKVKLQIYYKMLIWPKEEEYCKNKKNYIETGKNEFHHYKNPIFKNDVDINIILMSNNTLSSEKN